MNHDIYTSTAGIIFHFSKCQGLQVITFHTANSTVRTGVRPYKIQEKIFSMQNVSRIIITEHQIHILSQKKYSHIKIIFTNTYSLVLVCTELYSHFWCPHKKGFSESQQILFIFFSVPTTTWVLVYTELIVWHSGKNFFQGEWDSLKLSG